MSTAQDIANIRHADLAETASAVACPFDLFTSSPANARPVVRSPEQLHLHKALDEVGWNGVMELTEAIRGNVLTQREFSTTQDWTGRARAGDSDRRVSECLRLYRCQGGRIDQVCMRGRHPLGPTLREPRTAWYKSSHGCVRTEQWLMGQFNPSQRTMITT
jgi:hypothetical protein